jgi:hypothetical protein
MASVGSSLVKITPVFPLCSDGSGHRQQAVKTKYNKDKITNLDLEMAGLLFLWLIMEDVCGDLCKKRVALFSDNSPMVGWVHCFATRGSLVLAHLIQALALHLKLKGTCPITPLHIAGEENLMTDISSCSFGSEPKWICKSNHDLLCLFNTMFPLPSQASWTVFQFSSIISMRMTSMLLMMDFMLEEWRRLPKVGSLVGNAGQPTARLWEWTLSYRTPHSHQSEYVCSKALLNASVRGNTVMENKSKLGVSLVQSWPLDR